MSQIDQAAPPESVARPEAGDEPDELYGMTPEMAAFVGHMLDHAIETTDRMHRKLDDTIRYLRSDD